MSKMSLCNVEVIKIIGKYLNTSVGPVCFNTDKVLTTVLDKQNVEGFASIILRLVSKSSVKLSQRQILLCYQWLEHLAMYADQAVSNPTFARSFLKDVNKALEKNTYLTGQFLTVADVAAYHVLYPILERLSVSEREGLLHICRWSKHVQCQPKIIFAGLLLTFCLAFACGSPVDPQEVEVAPVVAIPVDAGEELLGAEESRWGGHHGRRGWGGHWGHRGYGGYYGRG